LLAGCARNISESQAEQIFKDTKPLMKRVCGSEKTIEAEALPQSVRDLRAISVHIRNDGMYIAMSSSFGTEDGMFLPCSPESFKPSAGTDPSFKKYSESTYLYHVAG
jgi:hypothetical protein